MATARSQQQSGLPADYYVPDYLVEVGGKALDPETKGDVIDLKVKLTKENIGSFQLNINNWDDKLLAFKYSDGKTFALGTEIHVKLGYVGKLVSVMRGTVQSLATQFPESGPPTLTVDCYDSLFKLKERKPKEGEQKIFLDMQDWEIAQVIARRYNLSFKGTQKGPRHERVVQKNQDDATFLMERAKRIQYDCFVSVDPKRGNETLNFVKPVDCRDGRPTNGYTFEWGKSLISFSSTLTSAQQVAKVTVRSWDPRTKKEVHYTATNEDLPYDASDYEIGPQANDKEDVVVDRPVLSDEEAKYLAVSLLHERRKKFKTGSGQVIGLPDLRPGGTVELKKLDKHFSGTYLVTKVNHSIGASGFTTQFEVEYLCAGETT
jgi:uncharacterized protein